MHYRWTWHCCTVGLWIITSPSNNDLDSFFQEFWAVLMNPPDFLETDFLGSIKELDPKFNFLATRSFCMWSRAYFFGRASGAPGIFHILNSKMLIPPLETAILVKIFGRAFGAPRKKIELCTIQLLISRLEIATIPPLETLFSQNFRAPKARPKKNWITKLMMS